jgi:5-methylthioadenosine/S-adenosylhomocysteine deaminase
MINFARHILFFIVFAGALQSWTFAASARLLVKNATLITVKGGGETPYIGYLAVGTDGKIMAIGAGAPPADLQAAETLDGTDRIVIPGFISAHSHIWQSAFRGLAPNEFVRNWVTVTRAQSNLGSAEDFYWFTLHGYLDHLRHGITSAYNFTQANRDPAFQEKQLKAGIDSGMRIVHAWARSRELPPTEQRELFLKFLDFAKPYGTSPLLLKLSISGSAASKEAVALDHALVQEFGLVNQTHYLEYPRELEEQRAQFRFFLETKALGPTLYFGHFIHTDDEILAAVGKAGGGMSWNPLSNGRLASGLADIPKYLKYGVTIGMGVDGQASADLPDPFENMRMGLYAIRASYKDGTVLTPADVLRFHTLGSATVMNVADKVGSLEVGKYGDFLVINPASVDRAPVYDPVATLVFACNTQNLEGVYVGGELVSSYCKLLKADFATTQRELHTRVLAIKNRAAVVSANPP